MFYVFSVAAFVMLYFFMFNIDFNEIEQSNNVDKRPRLDLISHPRTKLFFVFGVVFLLICLATS
ncbi:TPA: hypothetical protein I7730_14420 [Vibrio vulnificus]|uniref:Uncharacterized protein n=1 Tax=Vibrio vulnificus TaxID=672 RepID=A0A8H9TFK0_VIBVL|nr:hypothetical protein [Vibrio vulnificus]HAS8540982.1 hypothetical protein [Vibrio vulnificus]